MCVSPWVVYVVVALALLEFCVIFSSVTRWDGCTRDCYLYNFKGRIEDIARRLSFVEGRGRVRACFNPRLKCAELYTWREGVFAQIKVHGEMGEPDEVIVISNLPEKSKTLFFQSFPELITTFKSIKV